MNIPLLVTACSDVQKGVLHSSGRSFERPEDALRQLHKLFRCQPAGCAFCRYRLIDTTHSPSAGLAHHFERWRNSLPRAPQFAESQLPKFYGRM
jgi:hypothetical protein